MNYSSASSSRIYQEKPAFSKPSHHKPKGWTDSVLGYINEAKQWAMCLLRNRRLMNRPYTWAVHINLNEEIPPEQVASLWEQTKRKLNDRGVVCLWVREPNRLNKVHYHLIIKNAISKSALKKAIEESMPSRKVVQWRKRVEPIKKEWRLCHYVVKAKIRGHNKKGIMVADLYRNKRLLFHPKMPFRKIGTIGDFWEQDKSKTKMWDEIKAIEKRIAEGLEKPNVKRLCEYVYDLLGGCMSLKEIERLFGLDADGPVVQGWIERLLDGEWAEEDADEECQ